MIRILLFNLPWLYSSLFRASFFRIRRGETLLNLLIGVGHVNLEPWISINMTQKTSWRTRKSDETKIIDLISFDKIKIIPKLDYWFISQLHKKYVGSIAKPFMDFASIITPKKIPKYLL